MMNNFFQILQGFSAVANASTSSSHFLGVIQFKVLVSLDIPIFKGQIDVDALDKWVNLLESYFSIYNFSNREDITFTLLKVVPHVKHWWDIYYEKTSTKESEMFGSKPTWVEQL
jgi:hypothetical protein